VLLSPALYLADPWGAVEVDPTLKQKLTAEAPFYSVAIGLALKDV
jgi:Tfp pilus assembly PilM family ATPase